MLLLFSPEDLGSLCLAEDSPLCDSLTRQQITFKQYSPDKQQPYRLAAWFWVELVFVSIPLHILIHHEKN